MSARFMTACFLLLIVSFAFSQTDDKMAPQGSRTGCPSMAQVPAAPESAPAKLKPQINCPVVGGQIDKKHYVDYQGKRIYRCCPGCKEGVAKDPEKALKAQTTCPVMGNDIDRSLYVDYEGKRIYVCCSGCLGKLQKNPAKYLAKLEKSGQAAEVIGAQEEKVKGL